MATAVMERARTLTGAEISKHLDDIQGNIIKPYTFGLQRAVFVRIDDGPAGRKLVGGESPNVSCRQPRGSKANARSPTMSAGISPFGLRAIGMSERRVAELPGRVPEPVPSDAPNATAMSASCAPEHWHDGFGGEDIHIAVFIFSDDPDQIDADTAWLRDVCQNPPAASPKWQLTMAMPSRTATNTSAIATA